MIVFRPNVQSYMPGVDIVNRPVAAAASSWWLADNTIDAANVIAVYQPKGAASLAASYINLANPGTYDAAPGTAPSWNATDGWIGNGSSAYLIGPVHDGTNQMTIICRYSNAPSGTGTLFGWYSSATSTGVYIFPNYLSGVRYTYGFGAPSRADVAPELTAGVLALTGENQYRNGVLDGSITPYTVSTTPDLYILARNNGSGAENYSGAYIQAIAFYSGTLTSDQIAAVSTAMAAL